MNALETIRVSSRGQIVIPEELRNKLGITEGTKLVMIAENNRLILETEKNFLEYLEQFMETSGWKKLSEKNLSKIWDNPKDDEIWSKY